MKLLSKILAVAALTAAGASSAFATPIAGSISFTGSATISGGGGTFGTGDTLTFGGPAVMGWLGTAGNYLAAGASGSGVTFSQLKFPSSSFPGSYPISPLWTFSTGGLTYSFVLNSVIVETQNSVKLDLSGTGVATITGGSSTFDPTNAKFGLSVDNQGSTLTFSVSPSVTTLPEPMTLGLLGMGLVGLGGAMRRRKVAA